MIVVVVALVLGHHPVPLCADRLNVDAVHGCKVGGVKAGADQVVVDGFFVSVFNGFDAADGIGVHRELLLFSEI